MNGLTEQSTKVMRRVLAALCMILWPTFASAAEPALLSRAKDLADICATHMPNARAAKDAFKSAGFRYEGIIGRHHVYSLDGRRVLAGTTTTRAKQPACIISVSKMTPAEGKKLIQTWVRTAKAKPIGAAEAKQAGLTAGYVGTFRGGPIYLGVIEKLDFKIMRGAAIVAFAPN